MPVIQNIHEFPLRDFYDGVTTNRSGDLYQAYQYYLTQGGQDTPALLELWRKYLNSIGFKVVNSVQTSRDAWLTSQGGGVIPPLNPLPSTGTLVEPFESTTGWTNQNSHTAVLDPAKAVQGVNALRFDQVSSLAGVEYYKTFNDLDISQMGKVAFMAHLDDDYDWQSASSVAFATRLLGTGSIYNLATETGTNPGPLLVTKTGRHWISGSIANADPAVQGAATGNHQLRFRVGTAAGPKVGSVAFDAAYRNITGKSLVTFSWDDGRIDARTIAQPIMGPLGLVGDLALPTSLIGTGQPLNMNWDDVAFMKNAGWGISVDGTPLDTRMTDEPSIAAVLSGLNSQNADLVARGFEASKSFVYPNGSWKSDGTRVEKTSVTANGTTTLTMTDTTGIVAGMRIVMFGASRTVRVASVTNGTTIVATESIPSITVAASFVDDSGPFHGNKLQKALLAAGWVTGRTTNLGSWFTQYGLAPDQNIMHPGNSTTGKTSAELQAIVNAAIAKGDDVDLYFHFVGSSSGSGLTLPESEFANFMTWFANGPKAAGLAQDVTYKQRHQLRAVGVPTT